MSNRRDFLKSSLLVTGGIAAAQITPALANSQGGGGLPSNIIYTAEDPGVWDKKVASHAPQVSVKDGKVDVVTDHGMMEKHFIVRHTVISASGEVLGATTFSPEDDAVSSYELPADYSGKLYVTSFCNKHDLWLTEVTV
jgi:superoxide reductase